MPSHLNAHVANQMVADRVRAAEHHRLAAEARPARAALRSPLTLLASLRPRRRRTVVAVPAPAES